MYNFIAYKLDGRRSVSRIPKGLLRVNATFSFGRQFIAPAIADFVNIYPEVEVQMQLTDRPVNISDDGFDVCIRFGEVPDARITSKKIASNRRLLCASPTYLERYGMPTSPTDLQRHKFIVIRESDEIYGTWHLRSGTTQATVKVRGTQLTTGNRQSVGRCRGKAFCFAQSGALPRIFARDVLERCWQTGRFL